MTLKIEKKNLESRVDLRFCFLLDSVRQMEALNIVSWPSASISTSFYGSWRLEGLKPHFPDSFSARVLDVIYLLPLECTHVLFGIQKEVEVILSGAVVTDEHALTNMTFCHWPRFYTPLSDGPSHGYWAAVVLATVS